MSGSPDIDGASVTVLVAGPVTGYTVHALGWTPFFILTMFAGIPGLLLLARFAPWGDRDPRFSVEPAIRGEPLTAADLGRRGVAGGLVGLIGAAVLYLTMTQAILAADQKSSLDKQRELIAVLRSDAPPQDKAIPCKQLAIYGNKDAVPALAPLLADKELASWARIALTPFVCA